MQRRTLLSSAACGFLIWAASAGPARAEIHQVTTVRIHSRIRIDAGAAPIWRYATMGSHFASWIPEWKQPRNARINLMRVGDWLDSVDEWNNKGRSVVTYLSRDRELRLANDPLDGSFMCQTKLLLEADGAGTTVQFIEQYTDEGNATDARATAAKVQASMDRSLQSLKAAVENHRRGAGGGERR
jgi:hypothetical protein